MCSCTSILLSSFALEYYLSYSVCLPRIVFCCFFVHKFIIIIHSGWQETCSRVFVPSPIKQLAYTTAGGSLVCAACAQTCWLPEQLKENVSAKVSNKVHMPLHLHVLVVLRTKVHSLVHKHTQVHAPAHARQDF